MERGENRGGGTGHYGPAFLKRRILVQSLLLVHVLGLVDQLAHAPDPGPRLLGGLGHQVQVALATAELQCEAEVGGELIGDALQDL